MLWVWYVFFVLSKMEYVTISTKIITKSFCFQLNYFVPYTLVFITTESRLFLMWKFSMLNHVWKVTEGKWKRHTLIVGGGMYRGYTYNNWFTIDWMRQHRLSCAKECCTYFIRNLVAPYRAVLTPSSCFVYKEIARYKVSPWIHQQTLLKATSS